MTAVRAWRRRRGSALIEFAVGLAILTPVVVGGWQFLGAYKLVEDIHQASIRGVQQAALLRYDSPDETPTAEFRRAAEDLVLQSAVPGLRREHIRVAMRFAAGRPSELEVRISGCRLAIPGGAITLDGKPHALYPYRGHWSASRLP